MTEVYEMKTNHDGVEAIDLLILGQPVPEAFDRDGDYLSMFQNLAGSVRLRRVDIRGLGPADEVSPRSSVGMILTGSAAMLEENTPWMQLALRLTREALARQTPFLGVCFGHQLLGAACGARIGPNPNGRAAGTVRVANSPLSCSDPIFGELPPAFSANVSHRDVILGAGDTEIIPLATAPHDELHAIRVGSHAWGIQFHPEFNRATTQSFMRARTDALIEAYGQSGFERRLSSVEETPVSASIVERFCQFATSQPTGANK